jgi:hypothetical protein
MKAEKTASPPKPEPPRECWQYMASARAVQAFDLDPLGADGWELVSVVPKPGDPALVVAFFKRRLP